MYVNLNGVLKFVAAVFSKLPPLDVLRVLCNFQLTRLTRRILKNRYNNSLMEIFTNRHRVSNSPKM